MRILHTSDWHLGRSFHRVGMLEHQATFVDHLVGVIETERVDLVVVAGDIYDRALPHVDAVRLADETFARLAATRARVVLTSGNHDSAQRLGFGSRLIDAAGVFLRTDASGVGTPVLLEDAHGPVAVHGLPYLDPQALHEPWRLSGRSHEAAVAEAMRRVRADLARRPTRSVVLAHAFVAGGVPSESERDISVGGVSMVASSLFDDISYTALGHLHGRAVLGDTLRYSGSPLAYSFSEADHTKGCWLVELGRDGVESAEFVESPVPRRLARVRGDLDVLLTDPALAAVEDHWVQATLTDAVRPAHPMERLRARFPEALVLAFAPPSGSVGTTDGGSAGPPRPRGRPRLRLRDARGAGHARRGCPAADGLRRLCGGPGGRRPALRGGPMRLHRLSVTAFGPFVETAEVDFDALSEAGLFLLSGATGAGKSSVLDAVCFALYGAIPGDRNHAGRLRSDQAPPGLSPSVELDVTLADRRFRVVRSPAWERPKKRGTGLTREPAKVTLSERRHDEWSPLSSRLDEAGDLLSGLLGMNLDQFCQVALLPQGHFQAFLRADSAQRHQLLARLFRTGRFERVEGWLRDHRLMLRRESQTHLTTVADLVSRLSEAAGVAVPDEIGDLSAESADVAVESWARALSDRTASGLLAAETGSGAAQETARETAAAWEQGREIARSRGRVLEAAAIHERLMTAADEHGADVARLEAARRAQALRPLAGLVDERVHRLADEDASAARQLADAGAAGLDVSDLPGELGRLTHEISTVTVLLPQEQRLSALHAEHARRAEELRSLQHDGEVALAESSTLGEHLTRLAEELRIAADATRVLPAVEAEAARLRAVATAHSDRARFEAERAVATADHSAAVVRLLDLRERLLDVRERRIAGMAAELAGALAVGDDCPVCGSAEHPHPARAGASHPDAAAEREAQKAVDDAQAVEHALDLRVREATAALETAQQVASAVPTDDLDQVVGAAERTLAQTSAAAAAHPALAEQLDVAERRATSLDDERDSRRVRVAELTTTLEHLLSQAADLEEQVSAARGDHPLLSHAVERLEAARAAARRAHDAAVARAAARVAVDDAEEALARAALEAGFDDSAAARRSELAADDLARLDELVRHRRSELAAAEVVLAEPGARLLLESPETDLVSLEGAHRAAASALEQARAAHEVAQRRQARVAGLAAELRSALEAWAPVHRQLELATSVSSFAEGKAPDNRLQMRLSAYVLAYRLSQVVAAANARLAGMSDQRYSLEHVGRRGAGESRGGLSLVVRDDWSGESRDPATLSGGETFVVSLALALGLADVVAHEASGADLATLFVDEGFGSLDAETLDDVLDILDTLRENGRAVGVVSHVAEMRDRIPTQLVVSKARSGSTVRISC